VATVHFRDPRALAALLCDPDLAFGDLHVAGRIGVEGSLVDLLTMLFAARPPRGLVSWLPERLIAPVRTGLVRATRNAQHHYDVGNDFYELWLDQRMVYTCAYFPSPEASLEDAQLAKLDHVCRKLALRSGDRVIEAGCGWGALALHMARYYGCSVRAFNVSSEQVAYARECAEKAGLTDRVEFIEDDYRNIEGTCDAFVSVGMLEHVGIRYYEPLGQLVERTLAPGGRGLIHSIGRSHEQPLNRWTQKRLFPSAHPPTVREMCRIFEPNGLVILDLENLRLHYALTVRHWLERLEASFDRAVEIVGEAKARTWRLYLAGTVASFEASTLELFQVVFTRVGNDQIPWTRAHVYTGEPGRFGSVDPAGGG
jgi:cyclopropane-fatty-acyl-phospholipid synthase